MAKSTRIWSREIKIVVPNFFLGDDEKKIGVCPLAPDITDQSCTVSELRQTMMRRAERHIDRPEIPPGDGDIGGQSFDFGPPWSPLAEEFRSFVEVVEVTRTTATLTVNFVVPGHTLDRQRAPLPTGLRPVRRRKFSYTSSLGTDPLRGITTDPYGSLRYPSTLA